MQTQRAPFRIGVVMLLASLVVVGCGGEDTGGNHTGGRVSHHHQQMVAGLQMLFRTLAIQRQGIVFVESGILAAVVESSSCAISGSAERHDDGRLVFLDCQMTPEEVIQGTILESEAGFFYQDLSIVRHGRVSTMDGGYHRVDEGVMEVNITMTYPDFDDGPTVTATASGRIITSGDEVSGWYSYVTDKDTAAEREGSTCTFEGVSIEQLAAFVEADDAIGSFCPDVWVLSDSCLEAAGHLCERMPGQGCNTARMETAVGRVRASCGSRFSIAAGESYCIAFGAAVTYSVDACVRSGS